MKMATHGNRGGTCCDHNHSHHHSHDGYDDEDVSFTNDPTLASCCEKDQRAYDRAMKLKTLLTASDPTSGGVRFRQQLFQPPAPTMESRLHQQQQYHHPVVVTPAKAKEEEESDSDSEFDSELDDDLVMSARRLELQQQFQQAAQNAADGYGILQDVDLTTVVKEQNTQPMIPRVVFVTNNHFNTVAMRSAMEAVAKKFIGTKFYVVQWSEKEAALQHQLRLNAMPCVAAFRRGERVACFALEGKSATDPVTLWEGSIVPWLDMCNVLTTARQVEDKPKKTVAKGDGDIVDDEDCGEDSSFDCGVKDCRIRFSFQHEHVGPSQQSKETISSWRTG